MPASALVDPVRGRMLIATFERRAVSGRLDEQRCTLVVLGGQNQDPGRPVSMSSFACTRRTR